VFVSKASTDAWEPDPDVPGTEMHQLVHADGLWAGFTRYAGAGDPVSWTLGHREVALVLEGSVQIELDDGTVLEFGVGDLFSLPVGVATTWHMSQTFKEMWVMASD
jgi:ethanolamine utilization protein EutQ (cupin superfamily)